MDRFPCRTVDPCEPHASPPGIATDRSPWGLTRSLGLLLGSTVGMLLHGKTPNLPEIMRILRSR